MLYLPTWDNIILWIIMFITTRDKHYYDEDDIVVEGPKNKVEAVQSPSPEPPASPEQITSEEKPKQRKPRKPKAAVDPNIPEPLDIPIF